MPWQVTIKVLSYLVPMVVLWCFWLPVTRHYYVQDVAISDEMVNLAKEFPPDPMFNELNGMYFFFKGIQDKKQLVLTADKLLHGVVDIPGYPQSRISLPFDAGDLEQGSPRWRLGLAQFIVPRILLEAYEITNRDEFILSARDVILAFAAYERTAWLPKGFLWNDHALAERILVLGKLWYLYRKHASFQPEIAKVILNLVARTGQLLARPSQFTFNTNHGVMQNLALWHLFLTFPTIPNVEGYKQLALRRLTDQMKFYITDEGVVLEHSPHYQKAGIHFVSSAMRYLTLMDMQVAEDWQEKYNKSKGVYAQARRPDGSLPKFGDTHGGPDKLGPVVTEVDQQGRAGVLGYRDKWTPLNTYSVWPVAGYAVWWDGLSDWPNPNKLAQTVIGWSHFPGHAHKHADEMSVSLWAGGQTWWTNVGYWPYGVPGRSEALSWDGSNAPHLVDERSNSVRSTRLVYLGWTNNLAVIDLERRGVDKYRARRQVIYLSPHVWVIIDHISGKDKSRTNWTTSHNVKLTKTRIGKHSYCLEGENDTGSLSAFVLNSPGNSVKTTSGRLRPFAGWEVVDSVIKPTPAIIVEHVPRDSWSAMVWVWHKEEGLCSQLEQAPHMARWTNPEDWTIVVPLKSGGVDVWRKGGKVTLRDHRGTSKVETLKLAWATDPTHDIGKIAQAYSDAASKYQKFRVLYNYRVKVTWLLVAMFMAQEVFFVIWRRGSRKHYGKMVVLSVVAWASAGALLIMSFDVLIDLYRQF